MSIALRWTGLVPRNVGFRSQVHPEGAGRSQAAQNMPKTNKSWWLMMVPIELNIVPDEVERCSLLNRLRSPQGWFAFLRGCCLFLWTRHIESLRNFSGWCWFLYGWMWFLVRLSSVPRWASLVPRAVGSRSYKVVACSSKVCVSYRRFALFSRTRLLGVPWKVDSRSLLFLPCSSHGWCSFLQVWIVFPRRLSVVPRDPL